MKVLIEAVERGWAPDALARWGIRRLLARRLREEAGAGEAERRAADERLMEQLRADPLAVETAAANRQHYEVPTEFFLNVLGPRRKYSCCLYGEGVDDLGRAEEAMLALTAERAGLADGQQVLELGCGWGSLTLWMAERYPASAITAVTNSRTQKAFIEAECARRRLANVTVVQADMRDFDTDRPFDRVVSVEMFEHMRNYQRLMERIARWLRPGGKLFVHVFCHVRYAYLFEDRDETDWMARYFFTGGTMPSEDLLPRFRGTLELESQWSVNGRHYARTLLAWLENMDRNRNRLRGLFEQTYGAADRDRWWRRWRIFFLACAELFAYRGGEEWKVAHYRFVRPDGAP